jgi:hypothetical protein
VDVSEFLARMDEVKPIEHAGPELLARLQAIEEDPNGTHQDLNALQPAILRALGEMRKSLECVEYIVKRCSCMPPSPSNQVPPGF